ncbi:SpoIIE family protein phosphatase [Kitasatospora sp. NPDC001574]
MPVETGLTPSTRTIRPLLPRASRPPAPRTAALSGRRTAVLTFLCLAVTAACGLQQWSAVQLGGFDLGIFHQGVAAYAHFGLPVAPVKSYHHEFPPEFSLLGDHFSPVLAALAPLYWIWEDPRTLILGQALLLAAGVPLIRRIAVHCFRLPSPGPADASAPAAGPGGDASATARNGSLDLAVSCTSATAGARIGGDFYEAIPVPGGVRVIVGDVQGKGLPAVTGAVAVLQAFRESAPTPTNDLRTVADRIEERLARRTGGDEFVTAVIADCSHTGQVTLVNFGHPPPLVRRADGTTRLAEPDLPGLPLGLPFPDADGPGTCTVRLRHGDRILFYTDGTAEARNGDGDFFPLQERGALLDHDDLPEALTDLRRALVEYTGNRLDDDAAMLLLRFAPTAADAAAPPSRPRARMRPAAPSRTPRR